MRERSVIRVVKVAILGLCVAVVLFVMFIPRKAISNKTAVGARLKIASGKLKSSDEEGQINKSPGPFTNKPLVTPLIKNGGEQVNVRFELTQTRPVPQLNEHWSKILHFVPKKNNHDCLNLFTTSTSKNINATQGFVQAIAEINKKLSQKHWLSGRAPQHEKLTLTYQTLARQDFVHTVCEIGFNAGQSAVTWLTAKPDLVLYSFDIATTPWTKPLGKVVKWLFPERFTLTIGDSRVTVPKWAQLGKKCDIVSIDGGHTYPVVISDLINMGVIASKEHILIADDIYFPGVNKAWNEMTKKGSIKNLFDCWIHGKDIDFVIGHYIT